MRILLVTTQLPYPPISGGVIKTWRMLQHWSLQQGNVVRLVCGLKNDDPNYLVALKAKLPNVEIHAVEINRERNAGNLLKSYFTSPTLNVYRNWHPEIGQKVEEWAAKSDCIIIDHYEMGQYIPKKGAARIVLHEHNAEYVMWERLAEFENNPVKKALIKFESQRIKKAERRYAQSADLVWAAPNDIDELAKIGVPADKCEITYHLGEDEMLAWPDLVYSKTELALLFVGTLTWEANVDGLVWFLTEVWPKLKQQEPLLHFYIVGKNPDERIIALAKNDEHIELTGFVEDLAPYYNKSRVFVIPLRFGSGIKVKLLNALYRGMPTVTTAIGTEGLAAKTGVHLYESSEPSEQARHILELLHDEARWKLMSDSARELARQYSWDALMTKHDAELAKLLS